MSDEKVVVKWFVYAQVDFQSQRVNIGMMNTKEQAEEYAEDWRNKHNVIVTVEKVEW